MKNKKYVIGLPIALILGFGFYAFAQRTSVPPRVKASFEKKFPQVKKVSWGKESDKEWEAEFQMNGTEYSANFLEDGAWKETEREIKKKDIPDNVLATLNTQFPEYNIDEVELVENPNGSQYEIALEKGKEEMEVLIGTDGQLIKTIDE
ncbi:PepSY-like domain-containing protein [Allomuricauda sp. M10]|uniref:PepSY-like domain-containing protein n=1 Tax=Allomuricauda sp. M10 TaxID=2683292 RepID=UPI001D196A91|nr:PepSY-like domain-containing protein [Muricauda sp. M10]